MAEKLPWPVETLLAPVAVLISFSEQLLSVQRALMELCLGFLMSPTRDCAAALQGIGFLS